MSFGAIPTVRNVQQQSAARVLCGAGQNPILIQPSAEDLLSPLRAEQSSLLCNYHMCLLYADFLFRPKSKDEQREGGLRSGRDKGGEDYCTMSANTMKGSAAPDPSSSAPHPFPRGPGESSPV